MSEAPEHADEGDRRAEVRMLSVNLVNYSSEHKSLLSEEQLYVELGTARTIDISAGGCRVRTTQEIPEGVEMTFDLQLGEHIVHCQGLTVRVREIVPDKEWEVGVEFLDLDDLAKDGIRAYLTFKDGAEPA